MRNTYNVRVYIIVVILLQRYDIFSNVVSVAYGKYSNKNKTEITVNQFVKQKGILYPMENFWQGRGNTLKKHKKMADGRLPFLRNDVDDDWGAHDGGDGIQGDDAALAREETDEVAYQGYDCPAKDGGGQEYTVVVGGQQ